MKLSAVSGKVIWASNSVVTITSGSSYTSPTTGYMSNGHGYVSGGGGGGTVSTTQKNVEKVRIALFDGGERNAEFNCDPLFSPGNVATLVSRNGHWLAYYNQTTDRWYHHKLPLPFAQKLAVLAMWILAVYLSFGAIFGGFLKMSYGSRIYFDMNLASVFYVLFALGVIVFTVRFARKKRQEVEDAVIRLIRDQDSRYENEIAQSQEAWRKMLAEL